MGALKEALRLRAEEYRQHRQDFLSKHGEAKCGEVTWNQLFGGMRGVPSLPCYTSEVRPDDGLLLHRIPIVNFVKDTPLVLLPERLFLFLLLGKMPAESLLSSFSGRLAEPENKVVPDMVWDIIERMADDCHPMDIFCAALQAMNFDSNTANANLNHTAKGDRWEATVDDAVRILATMPSLVGAIYHAKYCGGAPKSRAEWRTRHFADLGEAFAARLNLKGGGAADVMRLYLVLHSDHGGGNVSAHTARLVLSAWSTPFQAFVAGMNGLAGPLHGLANQECLVFLQTVLNQFDDRVPSDDELKNVVRQTLRAGRVIPGFGHAVLRMVDPRFTAFMDFGKRHCASEPLYQLVDKLSRVIPEELKKHGKAKNPYPNVDAASGALLYHFGLREYDMYTVLFGASRAIGIMAQIILATLLCEPIERPKSIYFSLAEPFPDPEPAK